MQPLFPSRSNFIAKFSIVVGALLTVVLVAGAWWYTHSPAYSKVGIPVSQPVPFPHSLHITALELNCRYCHIGVDQAAFADLPPAETCMSCHSQVSPQSPNLKPVRESYASGVPLQWNRVYSMPDYVYFNHDIHVNKGVGCETCHGRMDKVTTAVREQYFYMNTCLDCHKDPAKFIRPKENVYDMGYVPSESQETLGPKLVKEYNIMSPNQLINCSICHR